MVEVLKNADLTVGEINNVPMRTMDGLEDRKLVTNAWRHPAIGNGIVTTTAGGTFPMFSKVKLTSLGIDAARAVQGLRTEPLDVS